MQRSKEFQFLIGNHLHNSLLAAIEENNNTDISIVKNNRIITTISKSIIFSSDTPLLFHYYSRQIDY